MNTIKGMISMVYLDNAATTKVSAEAAEAARRAMLECWGNPSSGHSLGMKAEKLLRASRTTAAKAIGAKEEELFFTSGGTEANNLAVLGTARGQKKRGNHVIVSAVEHPSVLESAKRLKDEGFDVTFLEPDIYGRITAAQVADALTEKTTLVSVMLVNNELGAVMPVREIADVIKRSGSGAILHCDAVQAFGKMPVSVSKLGCQLLSFSGHKIHAPKGIGALYISKTVKKPLSLCFGGEQQERVRPGTEPLPNIAAFAEAIKNVSGGKDEIKELNLYAREKLSALDCTINSASDASPYILSFSTGCIKSETMLNFLSSKEIYVSSGSACSKGKLSHVLTAAKLPRHIADSTIRLSFCDENTKEDIDILCAAVEEALGRLARFR